MLFLQRLRAFLSRFDMAFERLPAIGSNRQECCMDIVWIAALGLLWLAVAQLVVGLDRMGQPRGEKT